MKNKILILVMSLVFVFAVSGCNNSKNTTTSTQSDPQEYEEKEKEIAIKVYFSDNQAENLVEKEIKITLHEDEVLEEIVIEKLKEDPKDPELFNAIDENLKINLVKVEGRLAIVDISGKDLSGGSTQEKFLVESIVYSLVSLGHIDEVKFLVDGKSVETLMGHVDILDAFTQDDLTINIIR